MEGFRRRPFCAIVRVIKVALVMLKPSLIPTGPVVMSAMTTWSSTAGASWSGVHEQPGTAKFPFVDVHSVSFDGALPAAQTMSEERPTFHDSLKL